MNKLNVIAYLTYLPICVFITFYVGKVFYINGRHYLLSFFRNKESLVDAFNKILLVGYYLLCNLPIFRTGCKYTNVGVILEHFLGNGNKLC